MPTKIHALKEDPETWDCLRDRAVAIHLDGECYAFARALHQGLGWPLIGLMQGDVIRHALVREPSGLLRDVCGTTTAEERCRTFGLPLPAITREVQEHELVREGEPSEYILHVTRRARTTAELLFPELPWCESQEMRVTAFADALEKLSREHGMWIRPMVPGGVVMLSEQIDIEKGYALKPTYDGVTFTIDRYFE